MYGKTLEDFPDRFEAFTSALADFTPEQMNAGFERCLKTLSEFPVPAEVRAGCEWAIQEQQYAENHKRVLLERAKEDQIKAERFNPEPIQLPEHRTLSREEIAEEQERLRQEFQDMLKSSGLRTFGKSNR